MSGFRSLVAWWVGGAWGSISISSSDDSFTDATAAIVEYDGPSAAIVDSFSAVLANADDDVTCTIIDPGIVITTLDTRDITATLSRL